MSGRRGALPAASPWGRIEFIAKSVGTGGRVNTVGVVRERPGRSPGSRRNGAGAAGSGRPGCRDARVDVAGSCGRDGSRRSREEPFPPAPMRSCGVERIGRRAPAPSVRRDSRAEARPAAVRLRAGCSKGHSPLQHEAGVVGRRDRPRRLRARGGSRSRSGRRSRGRRLHRVFRGDRRQDQCRGGSSGMARAVAGGVAQRGRRWTAGLPGCPRRRRGILRQGRLPPVPGGTISTGADAQLRCGADRASGSRTVRPAGQSG
jgi:hypothetical protein